MPRRIGARRREREGKAGVVGDSSAEEMEEGNFFQILFLSLFEIAVVASRTAYLCYNSAQSVVCEDHRPCVREKKQKSLCDRRQKAGRPRLFKYW